MAKAFNAGFQRIVHRVRPVPVGSSDRVTKYRHFSAACSFGKCPRALTLDSSDRCNTPAQRGVMDFKIRSAGSRRGRRGSRPNGPHTSCSCSRASVTTKLVESSGSIRAAVGGGATDTCPPIERARQGPFPQQCRRRRHGFSAWTNASTSQTGSGRRRRCGRSLLNWDAARRRSAGKSLATNTLTVVSTVPTPPRHAPMLDVRDPKSPRSPSISSFGRSSSNGWTSGEAPSRSVRLCLMCFLSGRSCMWFPRRSIKPYTFKPAESCAAKSTMLFAPVGSAESRAGSPRNALHGSPIR